jgi:phosphatidylserine/phosphatidylglycerophosphate/cardiolipin synthase-like enzyme
MRNQSLAIDVLADELISELSGDSSVSAIRALKKEMPSLSNGDALKVCQLVCALASKNSTEDSVEIVATTPVSFLASTRKTRPVIQELIEGSSKNILITGYAISDHFEDLLKTINAKSKHGVVVELFVNKYETVKKVLADIEHTNRRFLKVYEYSGKEDDKMAALHAKTIVVDGTKTLISSANLSYHGLDGNVEIGVVIDSKAKAEQVIGIFDDLKRQKIFTLVGKGQKY